MILECLSKVKVCNTKQRTVQAAQVTAAAAPQAVGVTWETQAEQLFSNCWVLNLVVRKITTGL